MGASRRLSERIDLAAMTPAGALASSGYCLAARGKAYLVYVPDGGNVEIDLTDSPGKLGAQWIRAGDAKTVQRQQLSGGGKVAMAAPRHGSWLVYLNVRE